jgi:hypothetical protein
MDAVAAQRRTTIAVPVRVRQRPGMGRRLGRLLKAMATNVIRLDPPPRAVPREFFLFPLP